MTQVLVPLANGFEEVEAISIIDICRRGGIDVITAGLENKTAIGAHNIAIVTECLIDDVDVDGLDMVVLPGGWGGTEILAENKTILSILKEIQNSDKHIGAICAAPYALNKAGVLGDKFTCYPSIENKIDSTGYISNQAVVKDSKVITSQGVGTALCFALEIVRTLKGEKIYRQLKLDILAKC
jgi:4-methyl-5(b-hydroxyethyl)-thiazole monophosphate biosynthesis